ncbi:MAG: phosphoribosylformylglycinamidine synthase [Epulopiscium sp. Nele67-Bin004]|nr:MAG: phosphoribosylformylglycinamidine synthase [Epulopiscium sp. Nele67-Bin004]
MQRLYVEKKPNFDIEANKIKKELKTFLNIDSITNVRVFNRYDVDGISDEIYEVAKHTIFSEPQSDNIYNELPEMDAFIFGSSYLSGQYDQRADSCVQCLEALGAQNPIVKTATIYCIFGSNDETIVKHLINPIEKEQVSLHTVQMLEEQPIPNDVQILDGFIDYNDEEIAKFKQDIGLAMHIEDLKYFRDYFKDENRNPTITELKVVDTYWSDHCRHTTFMTELSEINAPDGPVKDSLEMYFKLREELGVTKKVSLMDMATIGAKYLKKQGRLSHVVETDEINACTIEDTIKVDGKDEEYLVLFKNETHNHPTEIEPFGGAATCLGGAIRDPLSGRAYVYQAMRVTGAANPNEKIADTMENKLPQRQITTVAANGYSSYGNQIGLATGEVREYYHEGYKAKRLEVGAVVGAVKKSSVRREVPQAGDVIMLIGGATGRDGCGGATGSSKEHTSESIRTCGSEVQKGNPVEERKLQRIFRNPNFTNKVKRCNDFGAGGVAVAIGEIADGLIIDLDKVVTKYSGLDGTELAISESQERMAIAISADDVEAVWALCDAENVTATVVATVTEEKRLIMKWRDKEIVNISRKFLDSAGVLQSVDVDIVNNEAEYTLDDSVFTSLNGASQKGLINQFDSTIGAGTVIMPYGGKYQTTKEIGMVAKIPTEGHTDSATFMTHGFDPHLTEKTPHGGAMLAVIDSVAKQVALGGEYDKIYLSFQEYFERLTTKEKWGKPTAALLGALQAQVGLGIGAIGGKDSMSGTFNDISVPPTFISFALSVGEAKNAVSGSFKKVGSKIALLHLKVTDDNKIDFDYIQKTYRNLSKYIKEGKVLSSYTVGYGGILYALVQMAMGNKIGATVLTEMGMNIKQKYYGDIIIEVESMDGIEDFVCIGETTNSNNVQVNSEIVSLENATAQLETTLINVFPHKVETTPVKDVPQTEVDTTYKGKEKSKPLVVIPVFPGTNCEYDTEKAFRDAGAEVKQVVFLNKTSQQIHHSMMMLEQAIKQADILAFAGGFSAGDEPDGSAKFIATIFRNERLQKAVQEHLKEGLIIGICNGFQVLVKLGLLPEGEISTRTENSATLTFNTLGKHISSIVNTKVVSNASPWLKYAKVGQCYQVPISHGEGRFVAPDDVVNTLIDNGQIFSQYVDIEGNIENVNGSTLNIEGIISKDGRILGKMGHSERYGDNLYKNVQISDVDQQIFLAGGEYFSK